MAPPLEPTRIGRYEVIRRIGMGGMGEVFLARTVGPGGISKQVCIKRTLPGRAMNAAAVTRFLDEARTALALQHANVVPVFDFGRDPGGLYLVMEWIDGCDLHALLSARRGRGERIPPVVAAHVAAEVCRALAYAHERRDGNGRPAGILHRDVTPRNILLSRLGEVRLTDFGIARAITAPGAATGTPAYMAPEEASGGPADARSDLYSLGLVLAEMLVGAPLRGRGSHDEARRPVAVPDLAGVPEEIAAAARRLLAPAPEDRFPSAEEAHRALLTPLAAEILRGATAPGAQLAGMVREAAAPSEEPLSPATAAGTTVGPAPRRWRWTPLLLGVVLAAAVALSLTRRRPAPAPLSAARPVPPALVRSPTPPPVPPPPEPRRTATARLRVKAPGSWVAVFLDDRKLADDAGEFDIPAGRHRLRVENPPLRFRREEWIAPRPGETITREFLPRP